MTPATLFLVGRAEREVMPDRFVVTVRIRTAILRTSQDAIVTAAQSRARLLRDLGDQLPNAEIRDAIIRTEDQTKRVEVTVPRDPHNPDAGYTTETRYEHLGYVGNSTIRVSSSADAAAATLAACSMHPDTDGTGYAFQISQELSSEVSHELECEAIGDALARADGLAAAAKCTVSGVLSIGEAPTGPLRDASFERSYAVMSAPSGDWDADDLEDALDELRPEPQRLAEQVPVRLAIAPSG
jgi:uncharacterized protein YggE